MQPPPPEPQPLPLPTAARGSWIRLKTRPDTSLTCPRAKFGGGASAALTVGSVYLGMLLLFIFAVLLTVPRNETQVYNITLTNDDYRVHIRIEVENIQPIQVKMTCDGSSFHRNSQVQVLYDWKEKLVAYRDSRRNRCYIRSSSGAQYIEEIETYRTLFLGKKSFATKSKPTVHYLVLPSPLSSAKQHYLLGGGQISFCSQSEVYWIVLYALDDDKSDESNDLPTIDGQNKNRTDENLYFDTCLQEIVLHM